MESNSLKRILLMLLITVVISVITAGIIIYVKANQINLSFSQSSDPVGIKDTKNILNQYPKLVKKVSIQQQIQGNVKAIGDNSLTVEVNGQVLTIVNDSTNKTHYSKLDSTTATNSAKPVLPKEIKPEEIKIGDLVLVTRVLDWQTGKITSLNVIVLPEK